MADSILSKAPEINYEEQATAVDFEEFEKVVRSRRSTRVYLDEKIPDSVVQKCLDLALLAPSSSNLQPAEFYWIKSNDIKKQIDTACLGQPAASTAPTIIVCVARADTWPKHQKLMVDILKQNPATPKAALTYYEKLVPLMMTQGFFSILGFLKFIATTVAGFTRPVPRGPFSHGDVKMWAVKSSALACENLMLAFRASGYDSCPMEGFDESRVKKILNLPCGAHVTMVVSAGKRNPKRGIYGPQIRFPRDMFVKEV